MRTPVGPSLRLAMVLAEASVEVPLLALQAIWERWLGPQRFGRKLAMLERVGCVERAPGDADLQRVLRLTAQGKAEAWGGRDPEAQWGRPWDGRWRLVLFDIPENRRALRLGLRRKLKGLEFGYLQNSVWVTPDSVESLKEAVAAERINVETLTLMEATPCGGESDADLVLGAWDFEQINRRYRDHLEVLKSAPRLDAGRRARAWLEVEWRAWTRAVRIDPLLPKALLPAGYVGREAWEKRRSLLRSLAREGRA